MDAPDPAHELGDALTRAATALDAGDTEAASVDMEAAGDLCRRLLAAGFRCPPPRWPGCVSCTNAAELPWSAWATA